MIPWSKRTPEIANLLNPSFCAILLYSATFEYEKKAKNVVPHGKKKTIRNVHKRK